MISLIKACLIKLIKLIRPASETGWGSWRILEHPRLDLGAGLIAPPAPHRSKDEGVKGIESVKGVRCVEGIEGVEGCQRCERSQRWPWSKIQRCQKVVNGVTGFKGVEGFKGVRRLSNVVTQHRSIAPGVAFAPRRTIKL